MSKYLYYIFLKDGFWQFNERACLLVGSSDTHLVLQVPVTLLSESDSILVSKSDVFESRLIALSECNRRNASQKANGILNKYKNVDLIKQESSAWEKAVEDR